MCESYVSAEQLNHMEPFYPLHAFVCEKCLLVQVGDYVTADHIYSEYAYFSSYSDSWLRHAREYVDMITERFRLGPQHFVIELASNDGYLLQNFVNKSISVLGIDPAANIAPHAIKRGVPTLVRFFGVETARELLAQGKQADLLIGNNVLPHVPALNDFVAGMKLLLKPGGVITMEFPHLWRLIESNQFDTIYHEHFSYFSFLTAEKAFAHHGLTMFDVEELTTHGGSLRIYARHANDDSKVTTARVAELRRREQELGFESLDMGFHARDILFIFLIEGAIVGAIGSVLGVALGLSMMEALAQIRIKTPFNTEPTFIPLDWGWSPIVMGIGFAMSSALAAAYLPARKGASVHPVDILRGAG